MRTVVGLAVLLMVGGGAGAQFPVPDGAGLVFVYGRSGSDTAAVVSWSLQDTWAAVPSWLAADLLYMVETNRLGGGLSVNLKENPQGLSLKLGAAALPGDLGWAGIYAGAIKRF